MQRKSPKRQGGDSWEGRSVIQDTRRNTSIKTKDNLCRDYDDTDTMEALTSFLT